MADGITFALPGVDDVDPGLAQTLASAADFAAPFAPLALVGLGVGPGDEVIVPGFTYVATISSVVYARAVPVLAEAAALGRSVAFAWWLGPEELGRAMMLALTLLLALFAYAIGSRPVITRFEGAVMLAAWCGYNLLLINQASAWQAA